MKLKTLKLALMVTGLSLFISFWALLIQFLRLMGVR